uniref:NACHT domain-containing protein n=1 Tax=Sphaeramia orbicularis TaxID=375764 RepID=A0A673ATX0_9TELE
MDQYEGVAPPSKSPLSGEPESRPLRSQTKVRSWSTGSEPRPRPEPQCVSMRSHQSKSLSPTFTRRFGEVTFCLDDLDVKHGQDQKDQHHRDLDGILKLLEPVVVSFVKNELERFQTVLKTDDREFSWDPGENEEQRRSREAFLKFTVHFMRMMKQKELAELLMMKMLSPACRYKLKCNLVKKYECVSEGVTKAGNQTFLKQIYTELCITEGGATEVIHEHEVTHIEATSMKYTKPEISFKCEDIFKTPPNRDQPIRTVLTKGVAGIGKTVSTQKFSLDWAEDKANQDIHFIFPFTFRELNVLKQKKFSLVELVQHFFTETTEAGIWIFEDLHVVFILDGLDECRPPLDFNNTQILTDVTESSSVDVLLMNLIRGNLLPSACLWITTRPAAANQIPAQWVDMVTEVRGFTDPQKEEYFRKRFRNKKQTNTIISHIQRSQSVHIMCHIPVFCWITATVLENVLKTTDRRQLPKTLTEMYIHFLVVQAKLTNVKYDGRSETDPPWSPETRKMIESLGKLAFEQLKKGNLIFYESDLTECGIDISSASVYSGVFTQVFIEERGLYQDKMFCFVHLSVQEFLAALHVHQTFTNTGVNLLSEEQTTSWPPVVIRKETKLSHFYQTAVDKAFKSPSGHLDLFLRFLLGLSLQTNQNLLQGLLIQRRNKSKTNQKTAKYVKQIIRDNSSERSINLFHCLNELKDHSLEEEIQQYLRSGSLSTDELSPAQWSALAFILLSSEKDLELFDLKKYSASEEALLKLVPVIKASNKTVLSGCLITEEGCASLADALSSNPTHLRELDLSYNHPGESGIRLLSSGLENPQWTLDTFNFNNCGKLRLKPGVRKFAVELTLDTNTAYRKLRLSHNNRKVVSQRQYQPYSDHPDRFDCFPQLLCSTALTGRCYWEVEWEGAVHIAVTLPRNPKEGERGRLQVWDERPLVEPELL